MAVLGCPARYVTLESLNLTSGAREGAIITASLIFSDFQVKMLQGNIDISFRVKGHKGTRRILLRAVPSLLIFVRLVSEGAGTVYFTSIRRERGGPFTTCAYLCFLPFSILHLECSHFPSTPFRALMCFTQCVSRSLQTMALLSSSHARYRQRVTRPTPHRIRADAVRYGDNLMQHVNEYYLYTYIALHLSSTNYSDTMGA
jgi:hypothetical protein